MFKKGNKVICEKPTSLLTKGNYYEVTFANEHTVEVIDDSGGTSGWYNDRFVLATDIYDNFVGFPNTPAIPIEAMQNKGTGIKHDQDKPDMSLLSTVGLLKVAQVMTFGKKKYNAHNWRGGFAWSRPLAASLRHIFAYLGGEDKDPETGISHLAHAVCCLLFVLEFEETHKELDDRFKAVK